MQEETQREASNKLVVADWDSGIVRYKRSDDSIHLLFELKRESGRIKVGRYSSQWIEFAAVDQALVSSDMCALMEDLPISAQYRCLTFAAESDHKALFPDN